MSRIIGKQLSSADFAVDATTEATSSTEASLKTAGGLAVAKKANIGTDLAVGGNLTVTGTASAATPTIDAHLATKLYVDTATAGGGDVSGPASSTDNALVRFDGTTGKLLQSITSATLSDLGEINVQALSQNLDYTNYNTSATIDDYRFSGKFIKCGSSAALASDITLTVPNATELNSQYPGASFQTSVNWLNFFISNKDATYSVILAANTGVVLQGTRFTVAPGTVAHFNALRNDIGGDMNLWTVYRVDSA